MQKITKLSFSYTPNKSGYLIGDVVAGSFKIFDISDGEILASNDKGKVLVFSAETGECLSHPKKALPGISKYPRYISMQILWDTDAQIRETFKNKEDDFKVIKNILKEAANTYPEGLVKIKMVWNDKTAVIRYREFIGKKPYFRFPGNSTDICLHCEGHYFYKQRSRAIKEDIPTMSETKAHYANKSFSQSISKHGACYIGYCYSGNDYTVSIEIPTSDEIKDFLDNEWKN